MRFSSILLACALLLTVACHHEPLMNAGSKVTTGGTIAGNVTTEDRHVPLAGRKVTAVDVSTGAKFDATTGVSGGYTIQVPKGRYRLDVELQSAEAIAKHPEEVTITNSDLDPHRDFVVTVKR
jgi:hypothetical protein